MSFDVDEFPLDSSIFPTLIIFPTLTEQDQDQDKDLAQGQDRDKDLAQGQDQDKDLAPGQDQDRDRDRDLEDDEFFLDLMIFVPADLDQLVAVEQAYFLSEKTEEKSRCQDENEGEGRDKEKNRDKYKDRERNRDRHRDTGRDEDRDKDKDQGESEVDRETCTRHPTSLEAAVASFQVRVSVVVDFLWQLLVVFLVIVWSCD
jgi:hypothetical protein